MVKSIGHSDEEIISNILKLHAEGNGIDLDPTYSKGNFYKNIPQPKYKFDLDPQSGDIIQADVENLPLPDETVKVTMFDPPFLATKGKSLNSTSGNIINRRFTVYPDEISLHTFYRNSLKELYRVTKKRGILIFKCQDKVSSGKQYFSHCFIYQQAIEIGWYPKDLFILLARNRIVADWQLKNQKNARKFHSYYWVFEKTNKRILYTNGHPNPKRNH